MNAPTTAVQTNLVVVVVVTKSLYNGLWARGIMSRKRYKTLMAFLHMVDPDEEVPGDKLRKINSSIESFKEQCRSLYQPTQNVAIDEKMDRSRRRRSWHH